MKFPSEVFGCEFNERQSSDIPMASFQLALTFSALMCLKLSELDIFFVKHIQVAEM